MSFPRSKNSFLTLNPGDLIFVKYSHVPWGSVIIFNKIIDEGSFWWWLEGTQPWQLKKSTEIPCEIVSSVTELYISKKFRETIKYLKISNIEKKRIKKWIRKKKFGKLLTSEYSGNRIFAKKYLKI